MDVNTIVPFTATIQAVLASVGMDVMKTAPP